MINPFLLKASVKVRPPADWGLSGHTRVCGGLVDVDIINLLFNQLVWLDSPSMLIFFAVILDVIVVHSVCSSLLIHSGINMKRSMTVRKWQWQVYFRGCHPSFSVYFNEQIIINGLIPYIMTLF